VKGWWRPWHGGRVRRVAGSQQKQGTIEKKTGQSREWVFWPFWTPVTQEGFGDGKGKSSALPYGGGDLRWCSGRETKRESETEKVEKRTGEVEGSRAAEECFARFSGEGREFRERFWDLDSLCFNLGGLNII